MNGIPSLDIFFWILSCSDQMQSYYVLREVIMMKQVLMVLKIRSRINIPLQRDANCIIITCLTKGPYRTPVHTDREVKLEEGLLTYIRHNITFTQLDIPRNINTHNTDLQLESTQTGTNTSPQQTYTYHHKTQHHHTTQHQMQT